MEKPPVYKVIRIDTKSSIPQTPTLGNQIKRVLVIFWLLVIGFFIIVTAGMIAIMLAIFVGMFLLFKRFELQRKLRKLSKQRFFK